MLDKVRSQDLIGLQFDGGFNDLLGFSGQFISATGYDALKPITSKVVYVPRELYDRHVDLVTKFNGKVLEGVEDILKEANRNRSGNLSREQRVQQIIESNRQIKAEQDEFFSDPKYQ